MPEPKYTPTEQRLLNFLADGEKHMPRDMVCCLHDDMGSPRNVRFHIGRLRPKINPGGLDIVCEVAGRTITYRMVRLLAPAVDGKR